MIRDSEIETLLVFHYVVQRMLDGPVVALDAEPRPGGAKKSGEIKSTSNPQSHKEDPFGD
jgi:hypothetical protein